MTRHDMFSGQAACDGGFHVLQPLCDSPYISSKTPYGILDCLECSVTILAKTDFQKSETKETRDKCIQLIWETKAVQVAAENVVAIIFVVLHDRLKTSGTKFVAKPRLDSGMTQSDEV